MKKLITLTGILLLYIPVLAQVTNSGKPHSWTFKDAAAISSIALPAFDVEKLRREDAVNDLKKDSPFRFGHEFQVDNNLNNSGKWETLDNGDRIWRIRFYSEGAKTMNFVFSDYFLPRGATLYLYNNDRSDLLGAYTSSQNTEQRVLGTWLIKGKDIWLEYYEPKASKGEGSLQLSKVVHGYRTSDEMAPMDSPDDNLNASGICNYDVDCTMGDIDGLKDINKKSVGLVIAGNSGFCTGVLLNNTSNDGTPYFLTANHCWEGSVSHGVPVEMWAFRFNWISPDPVCAQNENSTNTPDFYQTLSGSLLMAKRSDTDFCLVEITADIPDEWDIVYAGWSRSTTPPPSTFGIHHPYGDIMKVCKDTNSPTLEVLPNGKQVWKVGNWEMGVTENGSSGSPLFDNNGRVIGQLYNGEAACNGTSNNGGFDLYGRLDLSWDGEFSVFRLKDFLDPGNTDVAQLNYYAPALSRNENIAVDGMKVYPNPSNGLFTLNFDTASTALQYTVYDVLGQVVKTESLNSSQEQVIDLTANAAGIYLMKITDTTNTVKTVKLIKQ